MIALIIALTLAVSAPAAPAQKPVTGPHYAESYAWCADKFQGHPDLIAACGWGAYVSAPDAQAVTEWSA